MSVLVAKLVAVDLAFMPMAQAAPQEAAAAQSHCVTVETEVSGVEPQHGSAHAHEHDLSAPGAPSHHAAAADHTPSPSHHGCGSTSCKCSCAHAPADVAALNVAVPFVPHTHLPRFEAAPPANGGVSVHFRPPI
jgi:hypothetical protein